MSLGTRTRSLHDEIADIKRDLREEMGNTTTDLHKVLDRRILEVRVDIQAT
jgi:hypothetical protein